MPSAMHLERLRPLLPPHIALWAEKAPLTHPVKVCHIGMPKGIHLHNLTLALQQAGVEQCVLTCMSNEEAHLPSGIACYHYPYHTVDPDDDAAQMRLARFLDVVWRTEQPDIIHGHDFKRTSLPATIAKMRHGTPLLMSPWSLESIVRAESVALIFEKLCLKATDIVFYSQPKALEFLANFHTVPMPAFCRGLACAFDLEPFTGTPDYQAPPRILAGRMMRASSHQKELALSLPVLLDAYPEARVTFMQGLPLPYSLEETAKVKSLLDANGCLSACTFIEDFISLDDMARVLRAHNVAYTISSGDFGLSNFGIFAAVSGALVLTMDTPLLDGCMDDGIHALRHGSMTPHIMQALQRTCRLLPTHAVHMAKANKNMLFFDEQIQIPLLISLYTSLQNAQHF